MQRKILIVALIVIQFQNLFSQYDSEFWFVAPDATKRHASGFPSRFVCTTGDSAAYVTFEMPQNNGIFKELFIPPNQTRYFWFYKSLAEQDNIENQYNDIAPYGKSNKGIRIRARSIPQAQAKALDPGDTLEYYNVNINAYFDFMSGGTSTPTEYFDDGEIKAINTGAQNNADLYTLFGKNALGSEFYTIFQNELNNRKYNLLVTDTYKDATTSSFDVVFTEDNTYIDITVPANKYLYDPGEPSGYVTNATKRYGPFMRGETFKGVPSINPTYVGTEYNQTIIQEKFGRLASDRLTGVRIKTNNKQKIAVTFFDDSMGLSTCFNQGGDQMIPVDLIGSMYFAKNIGLTDVTREKVFVTAISNNTRIYANNVLKATLSQFQTFGIQISGPTTIWSPDTSFYAVQLTGTGCELGMAILPPINVCTGSDKVSFTRPIKRVLPNDRLQLMILCRTGAEDKFIVTGEGGKSGGTIPAGLFSAIPNNPNWKYLLLTDVYDKNEVPGELFIGVNVSTTIRNTKDVFHLAVINGSSGGNRFGYFSNFNVIKVSSSIIDPDINGRKNLNICAGQTAKLQVSGGSNFEWLEIINGKDTISARFLSDNYSTRPIAYPPNTSKKVSYYNYIAKVRGFCNVSAYTSVTIGVRPKPTAELELESNQGCSPLNIKVRNSSKNLSVFYLDYNDGKIDTGMYLNGSGIQTTKDSINIINNHTFYYNGNNPDTFQTYKLRLRVENPQKCKDTIVRILNVYPQVDITAFSAPQTEICDSTQVLFSQTSSNAHFYNWDFGENSSSYEPNPAAKLFRNLTSSFATYQTRLIARSKFLCADTAYTNIKVHPFIKAGFTVPKGSLCAPDSILFTNTSLNKTAIKRYEWDFGNLSTFNGANPFYQKYTNNSAVSQTKTISLTVKNELPSCSHTFSRKIFVHPSVTASYISDKFGTGSGTECNPLTLGFTSGVNNDPTVKHNWQFGDGSASSSQKDPSYTFNNLKTTDTSYNVIHTVRSDSGCIAMASKIYTVRGKIDAGFVIDKSTACADIDVKFTNASIGASKYEWDFDNNGAIDKSITSPTLFTNFSWPFVNNGNTKLTYKSLLTVTNATGDCSDTASAYISIYPKVTASINPLGAVSACNPVKITLENKSNTVATDFIWDFGDGTSFAGTGNVYHEYNNLDPVQKTFNTKLIARSANCADTAELDITSFPYIAADFHLDTSKVCAPDSVGFMNVKKPGIINYYWNFLGNNDSIKKNDATFKHFYSNTGSKPDTFNVKLTVENVNSCNTSLTRQLIVFPQAKSDFTPSVLADCQPLKVSFTNNTVIRDEIGTLFSWDFNDGDFSNDKNPSHIFYNNTNVNKDFIVKLSTRSAFNCTHDTTMKITAYAFVKAGFNLPVMGVCSDQDLHVLNSPSGQVNSNSWDYLNNSFNNKLNFKLNISNDTTLDTLFVGIRQIVKNNMGCPDTLIKTAYIFPKVISSISTADPTSGCQPLLVNFSNNSNIKNETGASFYWDFNDGKYSYDTLSTINEFSNNDTSNRTFTVKLTSRSRESCSHTDSIKITAFSKVSAGFNLNKSELCWGENLGITNTLNKNISKLEWDYESNHAYDTSYTYNSSKTFFSKIYKISGADSLRVYLKQRVSNKENCQDSITQSVLLFPKIDASFTYDTIKGCQPFRVTVRNATTPAKTPDMNYIWSVDDYGIYTHPDSLQLEFKNLKTQTVSKKVFLVAQKYNRCPGVFSADFQVLPYVEAKFSLPKAGVCHNEPLQIVNSSISDVQLFNWFNNSGPVNDFGNLDFNFTQSNFSSVHLKDTLTLIAQNSYGCESLLKEPFTVFPKVDAIIGSDALKFDTIQDCNPLPVTFKNNSNKPVAKYFSWNLGNGIINFSDAGTIQQTYSHLLPTDQKYTVTLEAKSDDACFGYDTITVVSYAHIDARFTLNKNQICSDDSLLASNNSEGGVKHSRWDWGDGKFIPGTSKVPLYKEYSNYTNVLENHKILLTVNNDHPQCTDTFSRYVKVFPRVIAKIASDSLFGDTIRGCHPLEVAFKNASNKLVADQFAWNLGNGVTRTDTGAFKHQYAHFGGRDSVCTVTLSAKSPYGCYGFDTISVISFAYIDARFTLNKNQLCSDDSLLVSNNSEGGVKHSRWEWGDGKFIPDTSKVPLYKEYSNYTNVLENHKILLTVSNDHPQCTDTFSRYVKVFPRVIAQIASDSLFGDTIRGCHPLEVAFKNASNKLVADQFAWNLGNGVTRTDTGAFKHQYAHFGGRDSVFTVTLSAKSPYGCYGFDTISLISFAYIDARFTLNKNQLCSDDSLLVSNNSEGGVKHNRWEWGDEKFIPDTSKVPLYKEYSNYTNVIENRKILLTVSNDHPQCTDTFSRIVNVYPRVIAKIAANDSAVCDSSNIVLYNQSNAVATQFVWNFDNGSSSSSTDKSIVQNFFHLYPNSWDYYVTLKASSNHGCTDSDTLKIVVAPYINALFTLDKKHICSGESISVFNNSPDGVSYNHWNWGDGSSIETTGANLTHTYINQSDTRQIRNVKLLVKNAELCSDSIIRTVEVFPQVVAQIHADKTKICDSTEIQFSNRSNAVAKMFEWNFGNGTSHRSDTLFSRTFFHLEPNTKPYSVVLQASSSDGRCSDKDTLDIEVFSYLKADFKLDDAEVCSHNKIYINNNSKGGIKSHYWYFEGEGDSVENNNALVITGLYENYNPVTRDSRIKLLVNNAQDCIDTFSRPIKIFPKVFAKFSPNVHEGCNPLRIDFMADSINDAVYYSWNFDNGNSSSQMEPSQVYFENLKPVRDTFNVHLTTLSENLCSYDTTINIITYAFLKADFKVEKSEICSGDSIKITENTPAGAKYSFWDYEGEGIYIPSGGARQFYRTYFNNDTTGKTFEYQLGLKVEDSDGCLDSVTTPIKIFPNVVADFRPDTFQICNNGTVRFYNLSSSFAKSMNWDFGDGNTSNIRGPEHKFKHRSSSDTLFKVHLKAMSQQLCYSEKDYTIKVFPFIQADFKLDNATICSGEKGRIQDVSKGGITQKLWDYESDGNIDATSKPSAFEHGYNNHDSIVKNIYMRLVVKNHAACSDTISRMFTVYPKVTANFSDATGKMSACHPFNAQFTAGNNTQAHYFNWFYENGLIGTASGKSVQRTFNNHTENDSTIRIKLVAVSKNGCSDSITKNLQIFHKPVARLELSETEGCPPFSPVISNVSRTSKSTFYWNFGDGESLATSSHENFSHTYDIAAEKTGNEIYRLHLRAETDKNCADTVGFYIKVFPQVSLTVDSVLPRCYPADIQFSVPLARNAVDYYWDFNNGNYSRLKEPEQRFGKISLDEEKFRVKLKAVSERGCKDSVYRDIWVYPSPNAEFMVNDFEKRYPPSGTTSFDFYDYTNPGPWDYTWNFGDGTTEYRQGIDILSHTYKYPFDGDFNVKMLVVNKNRSQCRDSAIHKLKLIPPFPIAIFDSLQPQCVPFTHRFKNMSLYGDKYKWDFGDGSPIVEKREPEHTFSKPGLYHVKLLVEGKGGTHIHYERVIINPKPSVDFKVEPMLVMLPDDHIRAFNTTQDANFYFWDFGDGTSDTVYSPIHYYKEMGEYKVSLKATNIYGCEDFMELPFPVRVDGKGKIIFPNAFTPSLTGATGGHYDQNDPQNNIFYPFNEGIQVYRLEIYNRWGELLFTSNDINIGWDGYYKGKLAKQDVYVYKAKGKFYNGKEFVRVGDLTLLHRE